MSQWAIQMVELVNPQLYWAVDERGCIPNFDYNRSILWDSNSDTRVHTVNALTEKRFSLLVRLQSKESGADLQSTCAAANDEGRSNPTLEELQEQRRRGFIVKVFLEKSDGSREQLAVTTSQFYFSSETQGGPCIEFKFDNVDLKNAVSRRGDTEPWAFVGKLSFEMTIISTPDGNALDGTGRDGKGFNVRTCQSQNTASIELYAICPALPRFLRLEGIPTSLLRFALGPQHKRASQEPLDCPYPIAITQRVFESGFKYERSGGAYSFTAGAAKNYNTTQLTKYLEIWSILNGSADQKAMATYGPQYQKNAPTVNCFDQTGILGICMSFACTDEDDRNSLGAYFVAPFGFLNNQPLVGYEHGIDGQQKEVVGCNNPFTSHSPELHLENKMDKNRSYFGSHVFLEFRNHIYDACAGPFMGSQFGKNGDLRGYLEMVIDAKPDTYPLTFWSGSHEVTNPDMKKYTADLDLVRSMTNVADNHRGMLGQIHNWTLDGSDWYQVPIDLSHEWDLENFALDIPDLGQFLVKTTKTHKEGPLVTSVSEPSSYTGAIVNDTNASAGGDVTWALEVNKDDHALLHLHITPSFEQAAAGRNSIFPKASPDNKPTEWQLAHEQIVTGQRGNINHATAIAGRFLIDCQSATLKQWQLEQIVKDVLEFSMKEGHPIFVGNKAADNGGKSDPEGGDRKRRHVIQTPVYHLSEYFVQVENCLDIDWTYTTGNMFLVDYEEGTRETFQDKYWKYEATTFTQDEGEKTINTGYRFQFRPKSPGRETIRLVFYDRHYNETYRFIDFVIDP